MRINQLLRRNVRELRNCETYSDKKSKHGKSTEKSQQQAKNLKKLAQTFQQD
jgi:hypothetical protein